MCSISNPSALIYNYFDISLLSLHPPPCFSHISPLHTHLLASPISPLSTPTSLLLPYLPSPHLP